MTSIQSSWGSIQNYLNNIRGYGENPFSQRLEGKEINCTISTGPSLLCLQHIENEKNFREGEGEIPAYSNPTRYTQSYVGQGAFGIVFSQQLGRPGIPENTFAIKSINDISDENLRNEVYFQTLAAEQDIAPKVYDFFICNCNGERKGFIIMEYLKDYIHPGLIENRIQEYKASDDMMKNQLAETYIQILDEKKAHIKNILNELNIIISDYQYLIKSDLSDIKVIDFGQAYHPTQSLIPDSSGGRRRRRSRSRSRSRRRSRRSNRGSNTKKKKRHHKKYYNKSIRY